MYLESIEVDNININMDPEDDFTDSQHKNISYLIDTLETVQRRLSKGGYIVMGNLTIVQKDAVDGPRN